MTTTKIDGICDPLFTEVREAFERNFKDCGEVGAAVCVTHRGRIVVDLWGGLSDPDTARPWTSDTVTVVWSSTKGATALCAHMLAARGELDFYTPVSHYWPEFAQNGKAHITVAMLLAHQAGLPVLTTAPSAEVYADWDEVTNALAAQAPLWEPGKAQGYHALTFGHLIGEVIRRITGMSLGTFFRREIAEPLGLDFWIGLPEAIEPRTASLIAATPSDNATEPNEFARLALTVPGSIPNLLLAHSGRLLEPGAMNRRIYRAAEIPAANGVTHARGLASLYRPLALGGSFGTTQLLPEDAIPRLAAVHTAGFDLMLQVPARFSLGFAKAADQGGQPHPRRESFCTSEEAFGHPGSGGSVGFADPRPEISFGYVMNKQGSGVSLNRRGQSLIDATYRALGFRKTLQSGLWFDPTLPPRR